MDCNCPYVDGASQPTRVAATLRFFLGHNQFLRKSCALSDLKLGGWFDVIRSVIARSKFTNPYFKNRRITRQ